MTTATPTTAGGSAAEASGMSGGLRVDVSASPANSTTTDPVAFAIHATEERAPGALAYQIQYGDGSTDENLTPSSCRGGPVGPAEETWNTSHQYANAGMYSVTVTASAGCTSDRATATVVVSVRAS